MGNSQQKLCERAGEEGAGSSGWRFPSGMFETASESDSDQEENTCSPPDRSTVTTAPRPRQLVSSVDFADPSRPTSVISDSRVIAEDHALISPYVETVTDDLSHLSPNSLAISPVDLLDDADTSSTLLASLTSLLQALQHLQESSHTHLDALHKLRDLIFEGDDVNERVASDMLTLGYPEVCFKIARCYLNRVPTESTDPEEEKNRWKILEILYHLLVKITDKSASFCRALTDAGLLQCTNRLLSREEHKNKCSTEVGIIFITIYPLQGCHCVADPQKVACGKSLTNSCLHKI